MCIHSKILISISDLSGRLNLLSYFRLLAATGLTVPEGHLSNTLVTEPEKMVSRSLTFDSPRKRESSMAELTFLKQ